MFAATAAAHRARIMRAEARGDLPGAYAATLAAEADGYAVLLRPSRRRRDGWTLTVQPAATAPAPTPVTAADLIAVATGNPDLAATATR